MPNLRLSKGTLMLNRGEIRLADLNPGRGTEPGKTRPVLIVQCQDLLDAEHPSTLILPLTTNLIADAAPLRLRIKAGGGLKHDSDLLIDQLRTIDNRRLAGETILQCPAETMEKVDQYLAELLDLHPVLQTVNPITP
jgi:mRNA interferase MazF